MKILIQVYYFMRSLILRGPYNTYKLAKAEFEHEKLLGLNTASFKRSESTEYFHYQGASYLILLRIFRDLEPKTKHFQFIDIGSGKGRAVFVAEYCGYEKVTGIELDPELVEEANKNKKQYKLRTKNAIIQFSQANALIYPFKNEPSLYFLFNPFNEEVLQKVLENILKINRSELWLIYMNPLYTGPFDKAGLKPIKTFKSGFYTEALVYKRDKLN